MTITSPNNNNNNDDNNQHRRCDDNPPSSIVIVTSSNNNDNNKEEKYDEEEGTTNFTVGNNYTPHRSSYTPFSLEQSTEQQQKQRPTLHRSSSYTFRPRRTKFRRFSIAQSTEEQQQIMMKPNSKKENADDIEFFSKYDGPYGHIRKILDYNYHSHYRKERQWLQDSIIDELISSVEGGVGEKKTNDEDDAKNQWFLCMVSGTSSSSEDDDLLLMDNKSSWMELVGKLPVTNLSNKVLHLDPSEIRRRLPEFFSYCKTLAASSSMTSIKDIISSSPSYRRKIDKFTRKETEYILEITVRAALESGIDVLLDYTSATYIDDVDKDWLYSILDSLQTRNSNNNEGSNDNNILSSLKLGLIHVMTKAAAAEEKKKKKYSSKKKKKSAQTDRANKSRIEKLKSKVDYCCEVAGNTTTNNDTLDESSSPVVTNEVCYIQKSPRQQQQQQAVNTQQQQPSTPPKNGKKSKQPKRLVAAAEKMFLELYMNKIWKKKQKNTANYDNCFSPQLSSEQNHAQEKKEAVQQCHGRFSAIRETLDYTFHQHYIKQRQMLQDNIIQHLLNAPTITDVDGFVCTTPTEPWIVFTAGVMGAGKSYTMKKLVAEDRFPMLAFVAVDPDEIRRYLPEYAVYIEENPETAGELTNKESGLIAEILTLAALRSGKNVLVDGSLRDYRWYQSYFGRLRVDFPILKQAIIHVTAPHKAVFDRAASRAITTGRVVPRKKLEAALEQVPKAVGILSPLVDYFSEIHNAAGSDDVDLVKGGETWSDFQQQWIQTCALRTFKKKKEISGGSNDTQKFYLPVAAPISIIEKDTFYFNNTTVTPAATAATTGI